MGHDDEWKDAYGLKKHDAGAKDASDEPVRKWWTKLEKDQHSGMSARRDYDAISQEIASSGDYSMKEIAKIVLEREKDKEAKGVAARLSDDDKKYAKEISNIIRSHTQEIV